MRFTCVGKVDMNDDFEVELSNSAKKALELDALIKELKLENQFQRFYSDSGGLLPPKTNEVYKDKHVAIAQSFIDAYMVAYEVALADKSTAKEDLAKSFFLDASKKFEPLDALTVFHIIQRMDRADKFTNLWEQELKKQLGGVVKSKTAKDAWQPYKEKFNLLIAEGEEQAEALEEIGNLIKAENTKRKANKEKLIGTKGGTLKPTRKTLLDQLVHKNRK